MHRRADDEAVAAPGPLRRPVHHVVHHALAQLGAGAAAGAAGACVPAQPEDLGGDAVGLQRAGHLRQGGVGAAPLVGAAVEQQNVH